MKSLLYFLLLLILLPAPGCVTAQAYVKGFTYGCNLTCKFIVSPAKYRNDSTTCTAEYKWSEYTRKNVILHTGHLLIDGEKHYFKTLKVSKLGYTGSWQYLSSHRQDTISHPFQTILALVDNPEAREVSIVWAESIYTRKGWIYFKHCRVAVVGSGQGFIQRKKYVAPRNWVVLPCRKQGWENEN